MEFTVNNPIRMDIIPIPDSTLAVEFIIKGSKKIAKINIYITVYYRNITHAHMTDVLTSKTVSIDTSDKDKNCRALIKIPEFKDYTKSFITFSIDPMNGPYSKAFIEDIKILGYSLKNVDESIIEDSSLPLCPIEDYHQKVAIDDSKNLKIEGPVRQIYRTHQVPYRQSATTYTDLHTAFVIPITRPKIGIQKDICQDEKIGITSRIVGKGPKIIEGPKIAIASIVRDEEMTGNLKMFLDCCQELEKYHNNIVYIFIEGDSLDKTYDTLKSWIEERDGSILGKKDTGYSSSGEKRDKLRTKYFAELRNTLARLIISIPDINEILMVDANYEWKGDLINQLRETNSDIAAPLTVSHKDSKGKYIFYDIWSFKKNGVEFWPFYPYIEDMEFERYIDVDSVGSCYLIKRKVLETGTIYDGDNESEHVGFCNNAHRLGFSTKINPKVYIRKIKKDILKSRTKDDIKNGEQK